MKSFVERRRSDVVSAYSDALRGYAYAILERDGFRCRYCGLDGRRCFDRWLTLSWDHLLPKGHPKRDDPEFIVAACTFCNTADNRYFDLVKSRGLALDELTQEQLVAQLKKYVEATRRSYYDFWIQNVASATSLAPAKTRSAVVAFLSDSRVHGLKASMEAGLDLTESLLAKRAHRQGSLWIHGVAHWS